MLRITVVFATLVSLCVAQSVPRFAYMNLVSDNKNVSGTLLLTRLWNNYIAITGGIYGLSPGQHGIHVHEFGDTGNQCLNAGRHFNPYGRNHGGPTDSERHVGDLGNTYTLENGFTRVALLDNVIAFDGPSNIIGKAIVIHAYEDDLGKGGSMDSKTTGNSGPRICCGIIKSLY